MARILIIDDDSHVGKTLSAMAQRAGHETTCSLTFQGGMSLLLESGFDVVLLDVWLPDGNGLDMLPSIRGMPHPPEVIIITGEGDPDSAELAIRNGVWDYVQKPLSIGEMALRLSRVVQYRREKETRRPTVALKLDGIVGTSMVMRECYDSLAKAASTGANVHLTGETGTGKELFAWAIHNNSSRTRESFVVVDCAALPETLVESVLFGHDKGAFTGADRSREGLIKQADGGTLFLDEVGELPLSIQRTLLRVLEERRFRPIGGSREIRSDFRLVAATNRDLDVMVQAGKFRKDLLFRLRSITIELPPLRKRHEDLKELVVYHMNRICEMNAMAPKGFSPDFFEVLARYEWPGNVRELVHCLEKALTHARHEPTVFPVHLPDHIRIHVARASVGTKSGAASDDAGISTTPGSLPSLKAFREAAITESEKKYLTTLMSLTRGDINEACRIAHIGRSRLYGLLKKHNITVNH